MCNANMALIPLVVICGLTTASAILDEPTSLAPPKHVGLPRPEHAANNRAFQGIPSMAVAPRGRLWATWYAGVTPAEDKNNYVVLSTSGDGGKTWKEILTVDPDGDGPVRAFDPELWVAPDGRLLFFWAQMDKGQRDVRLGVWCIETEEPDAAQPKWSEPRRIGDGVMMCKPLTLSTGEWALPISKWREHDNSAQLVVSSDKGKTWTVRGGCNVPVAARQFDEHMFIERKDGSLWLLARTKYGIGESVSTDHGRTWPELKPSAIPHTTSRFFIRRLDSGNLLLVKHGPFDKKTGRSHLMALVSKDDGKNWGGGFMLDERMGVSYPDGQQTPDGLIRIIYDYSRTGERNILMATFREEDATAGKEISKDVRLRQLVSKASGGKEKKAAPAKPKSLPEGDETDGRLPADGKDPGLPKVVLLGDSIRMGYAPLVEKLLAGKANIISPKANGGDSANNLKNLEAWAIRERPDIVHFNCGIHDVKKSKKTGEHQVPAEQYEANLRRIVERLRKETKATVIFATTTPILDERAAKGRAKAEYELLEASATQYNGIARKVMQELKVPVNELRSVMPDAATREKLISADGIHFTQEGREKLAAAVAEVITQRLANLKSK